jgi:hypothetical protein
LLIDGGISTVPQLPKQQQPKKKIGIYEMVFLIAKGYFSFLSFLISISSSKAILPPLSLSLF